jgi:hypothetical protein
MRIKTLILVGMIAALPALGQGTLNFSTAPFVLGGKCVLGAVVCGCKRKLVGRDRSASAVPDWGGRRVYSPDTPG